MMDFLAYVKEAHSAAHTLRNTQNALRSAILMEFADALQNHSEEILSANKRDYEQAKTNGMSSSLLDRLLLTDKRIIAMAEGVREIAALPDPLHKVLEERTLSSGVHLTKIAVPIGTIGIIYEARPNVTADCAALCLKSGNACVLKGGKEAYHSSLAIVSLIKTILQNHDMNPALVTLLPKISHEETQRFMECREYLDLLIPRGSRRLIQSVVDNARVPVIETGAGICHVYVEKSADFNMAKRIIINAKCQRPSVCNAMETLLIEKDIADTFVPFISSCMQQQGVMMYGDETATSLSNLIQPVRKDSYDTEYGDLIMNIHVVNSTEEAISHIEMHGTHHSDAIISEDIKEVEKFMNGVDSACVYHNASTRFTDGYVFGLGGEIGISTQKLHARGPMGIRELTTYTYHLEGKGEIRE